MIFGQMGLIFDFTWKIPGVLNCIPGVKLPKYTYILIYFNTVSPYPPPMLLYHYYTGANKYRVSKKICPTQIIVKMHHLLHLMTNDLKRQ